MNALEVFKVSRNMPMPNLKSEIRLSSFFLAAHLKDVRNAWWDDCSIIVAAVFRTLNANMKGIWNYFMGAKVGEIREHSRYLTSSFSACSLTFVL